MVGDEYDDPALKGDPCIFCEFVISLVVGVVLTLVVVSLY